MWIRHASFHRTMHKMDTISAHVQENVRDIWLKFNSFVIGLCGSLKAYRPSAGVDTPPACTERSTLV